MCLWLGGASAFAEPHACDRIITLSPSVTETVAALGLLPGIVAVSRYDTYPPEVRTLPNIGGLLDPNLELIASLRPGLVFGLTEQEDIASRLSRLDIRTLLVEHRNLEGILRSFSTIGGACGLDAARVNGEISKVRSVLERIRHDAAVLKEVRAIVVVNRAYDSDTLKDVYLSGSDGYYNDVLRIVGARNIFTTATGSFSAASIEGLISLDPDVIVEVLPPGSFRERSIDHFIKPWRDAPLIRAVREGKVFLLDDDWATVPGPRVTVLVEKLHALFRGRAS